MNTAQIPMPGALRLRNVHALGGADGSCELIYDLERGMVLEVPIELQAYVALALDRTEPTDEMLSWLVREDLLTSERFAEGAGDDDFASSGAWSGGHTDRELLLDLDCPGEAEAFELLEGYFRAAGERVPVRVRCHWATGFPGIEALRSIVGEARRLAAERRRAIAFDMALALDALDEATVRHLAGESFPVRVLAGTLTSAYEMEPKIARDLGVLAARFGDRLTLRVDLARGARLRDAWRLAESSGICHLDVVWAVGAEPTIGAELRDLESDLSHIADQICADLRAQRAPIDFQPLTRVVGRLIQREPMFDYEREPSRRPAWIGDVDSSFGLRGMEAPDVAQLWGSVDEFGGDSSSAIACEGCWARYLCPESRLLPTFAEASEPEEGRCNLLRSQFESAVRLHYRLAQMDPLATLPFLELALRASSEPRRGAIGLRSFG